MTSGLVTLDSRYDFATTLERLEREIEGKRINIFARIDHAAGAESVGLPLRPTTLLIFGNPAAGTPLMQAIQTAGIDLPLKALVWQDADGSVKITYIDPVWIAARHQGGEAAETSAARLSAAIGGLVRQATEP